MRGTGARHVLMTTDTVGGVWQYSTDLARELTKDGDTVTLAILGPSPSRAQRAGAGKIKGMQLVDTGQPLDWMCADARPIELAAREISRLARECGADLIHCNMPALAGCARFHVPVLAAVHGCIATWWQAARTEPLDPALHWHRDLMSRGLAMADVLVAPSASYASDVRATYGLQRAPLVVHNGRRVAHHARRARQRLDAVLTVGRMWDPVKNGALLDRVAANIDLPFLAAGVLRAPHGEEIAFSHIEPLGLMSQAELGELLASRPIFVSAARFEPFGLAVLEAAAAGCALVLSDIPTFRELWNGVALFVDPDDGDGFTAAIARLHAEPGFRQGLGEAAMLRSARYTPAAMARSISAIYRGLQSGRKAA